MLAVVKGFSATSNEVKTQRALSARASYLDIILKHVGPDIDIGKAYLHGRAHGHGQQEARADPF